MTAMEFKPILHGFALLESPRADGEDLWFSDMALGGLHRLRPDGALATWLPARKMIGGIAVNADGAVLCSGTGGIIWINPATNATGTLLDKIDGKPISGINDMIADAKGGLYFGTVDHKRMFRGEDFFGRSALYRLAPNGSVTQLATGLKFSNGMGLSPDASQLYFNDSSVGTYAYEILPNGSLTNRSLLCARGDCDGLAVDAEGAVWIAQISAGMITRILPNGAIARELPLHTGHVTSLCFGGADRCDLFVTTAAEGAGAAVV
jgi:sugar lactone lactonase YvrE